jgi:hypothetical protein
MCVLAQTVEVFYTAYGSAAVEEVARVRSGRWFDPDLLGVLIAEARRTVAKPAARGLEARDSASKTCEARPISHPGACGPHLPRLRRDKEAPEAIVGQPLAYHIV